jgi:hypothetical protein
MKATAMQPRDIDLEFQLEEQDYEEDKRRAAQVQALRLQLAACHEAIGSALALLRQEQTDAAMLVLDDALKGTRR